VLSGGAAKRGHVPGQVFSIDVTLNGLQALFEVVDVLRRAQGDAVASFGLGPSECAHRVVASSPYRRLRDYGSEETPQTLLIVATPIKRPYIWDLTPAISAIRYCLRAGLRVRLLEWLPASRRTGNNGLTEYTLAISECVAKLTNEGAGSRPFLMGHSLGGTLAAIYSAISPATINGLVLLAAPLCFQPGQSQFRDALVSLVPPKLSADTFPRSLLSQMSALASPGTFVWSRLVDAAFSLAARQTLEMHARIERWTLNEISLPGLLLQQIIDWLYRENRLCRGVLRIGDIDPTNLSAPTLAIVNTADEIAPAASLKPFAAALPSQAVRTIEYPGEVGVCLQHLGILVGSEARAKVWPEISTTSRQIRFRE
jgi:polyhydroxyalkanoate synthase subunit PhaC